MNTPEDTRSPVFAVYYPTDIPKSPKDFFPNLREAAKFASSPEAKSKGARFKRFPSSQEALNFLASGDVCVSPLAMSNSNDQAPAEPTSPLPSVSRVQMTELKKTIEKNMVEQFCNLVDTNPRYIINTSGDTATILMEGFRFNALHIAAKAGKVEIIQKLFERLTDIEYLMKCYATSKDDVMFRMTNILCSYLNTPDKGSGDTPLHMAAKFGHVEVVRTLLLQPLIDRAFCNKDNAPPFKVACARYHGEDKDKIKNDMELLLSGSFVALYRCSLDSSSAKVVITEEFPKLKLANENYRIGLDSSPQNKKQYNLAACAGPFRLQNDADNFYRKWMSTGKDTKLSDGEKGYERIGRELATQAGVQWSEAWFFLGNSLINLDDTTGLEAIDKYFREKRFTEANIKENNENIKRKLSFDDDSDEEIEQELFEDAIDYFPNDSLDGLSSCFAGMSLNSPTSRIISNMPEVDTDRFDTPPSTPPPVFILEEPTKSDNDLFLALSRLSSEKIEKFSSIRLFMSKLSTMAVQVRGNWPTKDSPRRSRRPPSRRLSMM